MAERTQSSIVVDALPERVLAVIADFEAYPQWTGAVKEIEVLQVDAAGRAERVRFVLDAGAIKDTYVLDYTWNMAGDGTGTVTWQLVEAGVLTSMDGSYALAARPGGNGGQAGTEVTYQLMVDVKIPMLGMLKRKAERVITDTALKELKKRVES